MIYQSHDKQPAKHIVQQECVQKKIETLQSSGMIFTHDMYTRGNNDSSVLKHCMYGPRRTARCVFRLCYKLQAQNGCHVGRSCNSDNLLLTIVMNTQHKIYLRL